MPLLLRLSGGTNGPRKFPTLFPCPRHTSPLVQILLTERSVWSSLNLHTFSTVPGSGRQPELRQQISGSTHPRSEKVMPLAKEPPIQGDNRPIRRVRSARNAKNIRDVQGASNAKGAPGIESASLSELRPEPFGRKGFYQSSVMRYTKNTRADNGPEKVEPFGTRDFYEISLRPYLKDIIKDTDPKEVRSFARKGFYEISVMHILKDIGKESDQDKVDEKSLSKAKKRSWLKGFNPTDAVVHALESAGVMPALSERGLVKPILAHTDPQYGATDSKRTEKGRIFVGPQTMDFSPRVLVKLTLAKYIRAVHSAGLSIELPTDDDWHKTHARVLDEVFDGKTKQVLHKQGYSIEDVANWAWILSTRSSEQAALRTLALCNQERAVPFKAVPTFVVLTLLRRTQITAQALKYLLKHILDRMQKRHNQKHGSSSRSALYEKLENHTTSDTYQASYPEMVRNDFILIIVRLTRHARKTWAAGLPGIATAFNQFFAPPPDSSLKPDEQSFRSFTYNKVVKLLGLPSNQTPFLSIPHHQRAQFKLLRQMSEYNPPLMLNREGYRAVARVQFAHRKSLQEREWALMKSRSWPPWKQEKIGLDAEVGVEHGISRGRATISKSNEAGYAKHTWERGGIILSGWDTDQSPTIQTRAFVNEHHLEVEQDDIQDRAIRTRVAHNDKGPTTEEPEVIWESRIRATRTLEEAWAIFLQFRQAQGTPSEMVSFAMAMKIKHDSYRNGDSTQGRHEETNDGLAGDGQELLPPPTNPRERVHVSTPPPTLDVFLRGEISKGVRFRGKFLSFVLAHASNFDNCTFYLRHSFLPPEVISMLLGNATLDRLRLRSIPPAIFASFVRFLARSKDRLPSRFRIANLFDIKSSDTKGKFNELVHAFRLVLVCQPEYRPPWHALISALSEEISRIRGDALDRDFMSQDVHSWDAILRLTQEMKTVDLNIDWSDLRLICVAYTKAARACYEFGRRWHRSFGEIPATESHQQESETTEPSSTFTRLDSYWRNDAEHRSRSKIKELGSVDNYYLKSSKYEFVMEQSHRILSQNQDVSVLKGMFRRLVSIGIGAGKSDKLRQRPQKVFEKDQKSINVDEMLPRVLETPHPSHLHAFIRALGHARDFAGLRELTYWMVTYATEINVVVSESRNGLPQMRKCLSAIRVFLEGDWVNEIMKDKDSFAQKRVPAGQAPEDLIQEVFDAVEEVAEWGGWPTDEDVFKYLEPQPKPSRVIRGV